MNILKEAEKGYKNAQTAMEYSGLLRKGGIGQHNVNLLARRLDQETGLGMENPARFVGFVVGVIRKTGDEILKKKKRY